MRLAISNIAWDVAEDEAIARLLVSSDVKAIDVVPGKYFPELARATDEDVLRVKNWWVERGIEIIGMQALLFGTTDLNMFGSPESQNAMLQHLSAVCRIGAGLGATRLAFGSPKNRDRTGLDDQQAAKVAVAFFRRLGDIAQNHGVLFCLEPNPTRYGANFMINSAETAELVIRIDHPAIKMLLDIGALTINGEDPANVLKKLTPLIAHIHASEPDLLPLGDGGAQHADVAAALTRNLPNHFVSIEMRATENEPHIVSIKRALAVAIHHYRNDRAKTRS